MPEFLRRSHSTDASALAGSVSEYIDVLRRSFDHLGSAVVAGGALLVLGWQRYRKGIRYPRSLATYAKADGLSLRACRVKRPVY